LFPLIPDLARDADDFPLACSEIVEIFSCPPPSFYFTPFFFSPRMHILGGFSTPKTKEPPHHSPNVFLVSQKVLPPQRYPPRKFPIFSPFGEHLYFLLRLPRGV